MVLFITWMILIWVRFCNQCVIIILQTYNQKFSMLFISNMAQKWSISFTGRTCSHCDCSVWKQFGSPAMCVYIMTSWHGNTFCITGPLWRESTGQQWVPFKKGLQCGPLVFSLAVEQTVELPVIWDTMALLWRHCNVYCRLYFSGYYLEPDPRRLPPSPGVLSPSSDCPILWQTARP